MMKETKPEAPKVTCPECKYQERCFPALKWFFSHLCQQGHRKAQREQPVPKEVMIGNIHAALKTESPPGDDP